MLASFKPTRVLQAGRRMMSIFSGADQTVYLAGKGVREVAGKKSDVTYAVAFTATPAINVLASETFVGGTAGVPADYFTTAFLIGKDGAAKVKQVSVEDMYKDATAKLAGAGGKFTSLKLNETFADGSKTDIAYTFNTADAPLVASFTSNGQAVKDTVTLKPVTFTDYNVAKSFVSGQVAAAEKARLDKLMAEADAKAKANADN